MRPEKKFSLILFVYNVMTGCSKKNRENIQEMETSIEIQPQVTANLPLNDRAQEFSKPFPGIHIHFSSESAAGQVSLMAYLPVAWTKVQNYISLKEWRKTCVNLNISD